MPEEENLLLPKIKRKIKELDETTLGKREITLTWQVK